MSSAANHRARSHRSHYRHASAMRGEQKHIIAREKRRAGMDGTPLICRLQAFRRRVAEHRKRDPEDKNTDS